MKQIEKKECNEECESIINPGQSITSTSDISDNGFNMNEI